jgi:hypothetical protein
MNDHGPLFNAQLEAVCSNFQVFGGKIKSLAVGEFVTQSGPTCGLGKQLKNIRIMQDNNFKK